MGHYIFSKGIKLTEVQKVWSSKDEFLLQKIMQSNTYNNYKKELIKGEIPLEQALREIIFGIRPFTPKYNHQYGYAVICICETIGTELPFTQELKFGYETDLVNEYIDNDFGLDDFIIEDMMIAEVPEPFDIPLIEDFPMIGLLPYSRLLKIQKEMQHINISDDYIEDLWENGEDDEDEDKACAYEHIKGFQNNVNFCVEHQLDLISFCH